LTEVLLDQIHGTNSHFVGFRNNFRYDGELSDLYAADTQSINNEIMRGSRLHSFIGNVLGYPEWPYSYEWNGTVCTNSGTSIWKWGYDTAVCTIADHDTKSKSTSLLHGNYDYDQETTTWNGEDDQDLPDSLYLSSEPAFWDDQGSGRPWPSIGPDISGEDSTYITDIPAKDRFESETYSGAVSSSGLSGHFSVNQ